MRVGINALFLIPEEVGGTETYLIEILHAFCKQSPWVKMLIFTNRDNDALFRKMFNPYSQVEVYKLNFSARFRYIRMVREQVELPVKAKVNEIDVLWSPGYTSPFICPCPQIVTIHDMQYKAHPEDLTPLARFATSILVWVAAKRSSRVITDSEFSRNEIMTRLKISADKINVIYAGVDPMFAVKPPGMSIGKAVSSIVNSKRSYILCVANSYPHKNVDTLVTAFNLILGKIPHRLVIVGKPGLGENALQRVLRGMTEPDRFTRLRYVSKHELISLYQYASLFAFPSRYEGFGLPILEAMMAGVPVVSTRCGSIPEVGQNCVCYFDALDEHDLANKILQILDLDTDKREKWSECAQRRAANFTWERTAKQVLRSFERVRHFK